jgi:tRNA A58 N-methylase Trm61
MFYHYYLRYIFTGNKLYLQVALDLVSPSSVVDKLVGVLGAGSMLAAYLPKLAPGNNYSHKLCNQSITQ